MVLSVYKFSFMEEWKSYKLGDISTIQTGPFGSQLHQSDYVESGVPCIMPTNIGRMLDFQVAGIAHISEGDALKLSRHIVHEGDIVYSRRGDIEKCAYVSQEQDGWFCGTGCLKITINSNLAVPKFVAYYLSTDEIKSWIVGNAVGTTMLNLNTSVLADVPLSLPSIQMQKRCVQILDSIENKIALNNRINHNLEEQARALYKSWFVDFEPCKGGNFVDSELGLIPEGWRVGTLSELGDIVAGGTPSKTKPEYYTNNGISWLTPKDLSVKCNKFTARGEIDITEDGYKNSSAKLMPRGSVLFSSRAPIGYISIAKGDICTNQGFKSVVPTYAGTAYLYYWLCENTEAIEAQASGSTFKEASGSLMRFFPALVPEKSVIDSFEKELSPILNEQEILEEEINHAEQIRDSLLPRLMSGELLMNC